MRPKNNIFISFTLLAALYLLAGCDGSTKLLGNSASVAPSDEEFTILLRTFTGPGHMQEAQRYKENTEQYAGWKNLYVVTKFNSSELYWGRYQTLDAAKPNIIRAHAYKTGVGIKPYPQALVLKIPGKDVGPAEYNLAFAKGSYTVQIAEFYNVPSANYVGRKNFAVEYCKQLRDQGEEAYFFHGLTKSIVTVGLFDESAFENRKANSDAVVETYVKDQRINQIIAKHPLLAENGRKARIRVSKNETKTQWIEKRSYVIAVPKKEENEFDRDSNAQSR